jgi:Sodium/hydrogen exchanger family
VYPINLDNASMCSYFLPPIIFYAGLACKKKRFFRNFWSIASFGIVGTYFLFAFIALFLFGLSKLPNILTTAVRQFIRDPSPHVTLPLVTAICRVFRVPTQTFNPGNGTPHCPSVHWLGWWALGHGPSPPVCPCKTAPAWLGQLRPRC